MDQVLFGISVAAGTAYMLVGCFAKNRLERCIFRSAMFVGTCIVFAAFVIVKG
jgi:hypothetical protein